MNDKRIIVTKVSGEKDLYSADKLRRSLIRSGTDKHHVDSILKVIESKLYNGIPTKKIYQTAFNLLKKQSRIQAGKYNLKKAIMALGPSGFPFEKYIGAIFESQGYKVKTQQVLEGECVKHEIDVSAEKGNQVLLMECKFHQNQGIICDVKIPLYIHSRFQDVLKMWNRKDPDKILEGWVVTNTKFSSDAIKYGVCAGLKMLGWNYPGKKSLGKMVDESGLYPITCLTTISAKEKERILESGVVLCRDIEKRKEILQAAGISASRISAVLTEISGLCKT